MKKTRLTAQSLVLFEMILADTTQPTIIAV